MNHFVKNFTVEGEVSSLHRKVSDVKGDVNSVKFNISQDIKQVRTSIEDVKLDTNQCVIDAAHNEFALEQHVTSCDEKIEALEDTVRQTVTQEYVPLQGEVSQIGRQVGTISTSLANQQRQ